MSGPIDHELARQYGLQADAIIAAGEYRRSAGLTVSIRPELDDAVRNTVLHAAAETIPISEWPRVASELRVVNESSLAAARAALDHGRRPVVLNFANAFVPGGGYNSGSRAQEESLCWSSALVATLKAQRPFYDASRSTGDPLATDGLIYSPDVPVFRTGETLLDEPYLVSFITAAAPDARHLPGREAEIEPAFRRRVPRILAAGLLHGHDAIVLGAWGCGAFCCDPVMVADVFASENGRFEGAYREVTFAILDWSNDRRTIAPFERALLRGD